jgi:hypothetical protein
MQQVTLMVHKRTRVHSTKTKFQESNKLVEDLDVDKLHYSVFN